MKQNSLYYRQTRAVFFFLFAAVFTGIVCTNIWNTSLYLLLSAPIIAGLLVLFFRAAGKWEDLLTRRYFLLLILYAICMLSVQIGLSTLLRYHPMYDIEAIYQNALQWVDTGTFGTYSSETSAVGYLYYYPNNLGGMALLAAVFKVCRLLRIEDTFLAASVFNSLLIVSTICLTSLIAKRLWGVKQAVTVLLLYLLSLPFFFAAPVFYTDFLSILFPVLAFYLFVRQQQGPQTPVRSICLWAAVALAAAVGMLVKFTVVIVLAACLVWLLCSQKWKQAALFALTAGLVTAVVLFSFNHYMYAVHLDKNRAEQQNMPYSHWVMMGLSETGTYNEPDLKFARFIDDPKERSAAIQGEIQTRLKQLGLGGVFRLYWEKGARVFGDGTFELDHFLQYDPIQPNLLHGFLLKGGTYYPVYRFACNSVFTAILLLAVCYAWYACFFKRKIGGCMVPQLCMFGILLFLMVWEANSRYIINFLPMVLLSALPGISVLSSFDKR